MPLKCIIDHLVYYIFYAAYLEFMATLPEDYSSSQQGPASLQIGMWDQEEHCRFLRGSLSFTVRNRTVWQGLETGARNDRHSPRETNPIALSKICQESRQDGQENQAQGTQLPMPRCGPRV